MSSVLALAWSTDSAGERLVTAGLVVLAALWVFFGYTRAPQPRQAHPVRMIVYFIGLLAIASVLATREYLFFIFLITGFFHATVLRPWPVVIAGVFATSVLVNTVIGGFPTNAEWWTIYVAIIVIQTLAIGGGVLLGERLAEQSEQRRLAVARLEAALEENAGLHAQLLTQAREAGVLDERQRMAARDPRHDRPGTDRDRHPARGGRAGPRPARGLATARPERDRPGPGEPVGGAAIGRGLAARAPRDRPVARCARRGRPAVVGAATASRSR